MKLKKSQLKELIKQAIVEDIFDKEIKNPKTGNMIKLRTMKTEGVITGKNKYYCFEDDPRITTVGKIPGISMFQTLCQTVAPSTVADSCNSGSTPDRAAR